MIDGLRVLYDCLFTSSRFQEFCMSYYQLSFGSKFIRGSCSIKLVKSVSSRQVLCYSIVKKVERLSTSLSFIMLFRQPTASSENLQTPSICPHTPSMFEKPYHLTGAQ